MTLELWVFAALVVYGLGVLTGAAAVRCRYGAARSRPLLIDASAAPLPAATARATRRSDRKRRLGLEAHW